MSEPLEVPVSGEVALGFEAVREAFTDNFTERGEVGAGVSIFVRGRLVVDLVGGWATHDRSREWASNTIVDFYSAGKPLVTLLVLQLVDSGLIELDAPIAQYWPEFAVEHKEEATVRHALCHRAGVPAIRRDLTNEDLWNWTTMTEALAESRPWWVPGTEHAYHTNTYGHLIGEIAQRVGGFSPSAALARLVEPLGAQLLFGVPIDEQYRCAEVVLETVKTPTSTSTNQNIESRPMVLRSYFNPPGYSSFGVVNSSQWRSAEIPSTNGHGTANGLAKLYHGLLTSDRLLSHELLSEATSAQSVGFCPVLGEQVTFGLGFKPTTARRPFGPNQRSFGHFGTGGALGFADPDAEVAFGYVMNHVIPRWQSSRNRALIEALYRSL